jgi:hypothetical protein
MGEKRALDPPRYFLFEGLPETKVDIFDLMARKADKVMVMALVRAEIIVELAVVTENPGHHTAIGKLVQDAIYRGKTDVPAGLAHLPLQLLGAQESRFGRHDFENRASPGRHLQFEPSQQSFKVLHAGHLIK